MTKFIDSFQTVANALVGIKPFNKELQKIALNYKIKRKVLGPVVDLYRQMSQWLQLVTEVMTNTTGSVEDMNVALDTTVSIFAPFLGALRVIKMSLFFLVGIFALVAGGLVLFTGSIGGATAAFPAFFAGFEGIKDSILGIIGHLQTIGATILSLDWSPLLNVAAAAIGGIIMLIVNFYVLAFDIIAMVMGEFAKLFTFMEESGAFQAIINGVTGILTAFLMAFGYIGEILAVFGISFDGIFAAVSIIWGGFVDVLINSGLIQFFAEFIQLIGLILPPFVYVVGEILVLIAMLIVMFYGPLFEVIFELGKILVNVVVGAVAIVVAAFRLGFAYIGFVVKFWMDIISGVIKLFTAIFTGDWGAIPGIVSDIFSGMWNNISDFIGDVVNIFGDLFDSLVNIFDNIGDALIGAITSAIDFILGPIDELMGKLDDVFSISSGLGSVAGMIGIPGYSSGGISSGPSSGYPVALHGTEAVVPLPNGSSIPVTIKSMGGGGDNITVNIAVKGGGNARDIARAVSQEVQRTFRNRARSGSFTRGI